MIIAFIGHRYVKDVKMLKLKIKSMIETLILKDNTDTFLFGSKSQFNDICYETVTELKIKYPYIRRIYVRSAYEYIDNEYKDYLLSLYEDSIFPIAVRDAGRASYIRRNEAMIDMCDVLVVYFLADYKPLENKSRKSGTGLAIRYAVRKGKSVINFATKIIETIDEK